MMDLLFTVMVTGPLAGAGGPLGDRGEREKEERIHSFLGIYSFRFTLILPR
jgi:hypothetical protein